eukprot:scaffold1482_cov120-Cylindrotheca_fusiformis.AAC.22
MGDGDGQNAMSGRSIAKEGVRRARGQLIDAFAKRIANVATAKAEQPLQEVRKNLPNTPEQVRDLPFYDSTLNALKYQRDNYLVGELYAERRRRQRDKDPFAPAALNRMPYDARALGSVQTIKLGSWFIPSPTVRDALLPIVVGLPSGVLREPILNATVNAIPLAQPSLDRVVKYSLLQFMDDPQWREVMKSQTNTYISYRE